MGLKAFCPAGAKFLKSKMKQIRNCLVRKDLIHFVQSMLREVNVEITSGLALNTMGATETEYMLSIPYNPDKDPPLDGQSGKLR